MKALLIPFLTSFLGMASAAVAGELPGPSRGPGPIFTATLTGTNALPPNNSPLSTVAAVYGPFLFPEEPFAYEFYFRVDFHASPIIGHDNILPDVVSLQTQDGMPVMDSYRPPGEDSPLVLRRIPNPDFWCFLTSTGLVCPPRFTVDFGSALGLTAEQFTELTTGQWYMNATFVTSNGVPIPDYTIRGQILPAPIVFRVLLTGGKDVPPNASGDTSTGVLTLLGNNLTYQVRVSFADWTGEIRGPAQPGSNAPLIFDLGAERCAIPNPPHPGGCVFTGSVVLSDEQVAQLLAGLWYVRVNPATRPDLGLRAQIILDADGDAVPDDRDKCPDTETGIPVDDNGCSIDQLCPCNSPWANRNEYLKCVKEQALRFFREGRITQGERHAIVKQAQSFADALNR